MTITMTTGVARANVAYITHARALLSARVVLTELGPVTLTKPVTVRVVGYGGATARGASDGGVVTSTWAVEPVDGRDASPSGEGFRVQGPSFAEDGSEVSGDPGWERVRTERTAVPARRYATRSRIRQAGSDGECQA